MGLLGREEEEHGVNTAFDTIAQLHAKELWGRRLIDGDAEIAAPRGDGLRRFWIGKIGLEYMGEGVPDRCRLRFDGLAGEHGLDSLREVLLEERCVLLKRWRDVCIHLRHPDGREVMLRIGDLRGGRGDRTR